MSVNRSRHTTNTATRGTPGRPARLRGTQQSSRPEEAAYRIMMDFIKKSSNDDNVIEQTFNKIVEKLEAQHTDRNAFNNQFSELLGICRALRSEPTYSAEKQQAIANLYTKMCEKQ